jgi:hypothetical protein
MFSPCHRAPAAGATGHGGTALFLAVRRAAQQRVQDGTAPQTLLAELRVDAVAARAGRGRRGGVPSRTDADAGAG